MRVTNFGDHTILNENNLMGELRCTVTWHGYMAQLHGTVVWQCDLICLQLLLSNGLESFSIIIKILVWQPHFNNSYCEQLSIL